ncbi:MAG: acyltransferase family protein [Spirochaetaceae bacterium]|jgi:surface polysaccharide O-acyltransferase-like enzyme|nr:acyltransferase family protein [Spirochaetaceae bacterium]
MTVEDATYSRDTEYINILRPAACFAVIAFHVFHFIYAFSLQFLTEMEAYFCDVLRNAWAWNVPTFFMISGVIFLNPQKQFSIHKLLTKYVFRLVLALFVFGVPYAFIEILFEANYKFNFDQIGLSVLNTIQGKTWDHIWFLYSMIGLYLLLPLFKTFVSNVGKEAFIYILSVLFIFACLIPAAESISSLKSGFSIPINSIYVFYFLLGHYIHKYNVTLSNKILAGMGLLYVVYIMVLPLFPCLKKADAVGGGGVISTITVFCFARQNLKSNAIFNFISPLCFGAYLIHMLFLNFFYRILKFTPEKYSVPLTAAVLIIAVSFLSAASSFLARKIKILREHLL